MCVVIEVALIVEMYEVMVVVIMVSWCHASSLGVFGKVVRLALVVVSLSGVLMITEGVVAVLEEDSAQRELWNFGYPLPLAYGKIRTLLK